MEPTFDLYSSFVTLALGRVWRYLVTQDNVCLAQVCDESREIKRGGKGQSCLCEVKCVV